MSLSSVNSVVESDWRERGGERSEPERDRRLDSTAPHGVGPAIPNPQVAPKAEKAKRRKFSASDKRRILEAVDQASEPGEIGRILRREGLYHAQLSKWRRQRAQGIDLGLSEKARGVKGPCVNRFAADGRRLCCRSIAPLLESIQWLLARAFDNAFDTPGHVGHLVAQEQHLFDWPTLQTLY